MELIRDSEWKSVSAGASEGSCIGAVGAAIGVAGAAGPVGVAAASLGAIGAAVSCAQGQATGSTTAADNSCTDAMGNNTCSEGDGGGGGGGKVICTEFCRNGTIPHDIWMADIRYSLANFSERTMRGYHLWGIPFVRMMRKYPLVRLVAKSPTRWFAEDIAYRMGVRSRPNRKGWVLREVFFRPLCTCLGLFAKARDWRALFTDSPVSA